MCKCTLLEWEPVDLDHIKPIRLGGLHTLENLRFVHQFCNRRRPRFRLRFPK
jgi:5-methylcytosine-specific restriction endonuclease McrA